MSRKLKILLFFFGLFLIWIFSAPFLAENLIVEKPLGKSDAILVLGGGSVYQERTQKAAEVYKTGVAPKIFLTNDGEQGGWNVKEQRNPFYYEKARWELINQGVPETAIEVLPETVNATQDEAVLLEKIMREKNFSSILLVTSAYHTRRTLSVFEKILPKNAEIGIVSPPTGIQTPLPKFWWLSPKGWQFVAGEYLKIVYYWVFY